MKAEKLVGLMACAVACASFSSFAATTDWFGATPSGTATNLVGATATGTFTVENSKFNIDNDEDTALKLTPGSAPSTGDGIVIISATAELTPNSTNDFDVVTGAKAGFAVGIDDQDVTNYYGYANGTWTKLTGAVPTSAETSFKLVLDYRTGKKTVKFFVGDTQLSSETAFSIGDASALASVDAFGTGSISLIDADCEVAEVSYGGIKYGSVAEALADATAASDPDAMANIKTPDGSTAQSASGLPVAICAAAGLSLADGDATITVVPVGNDTNTGNVTLQMDTTGLNPEPGVVIKFAVKKNGVQQGDDYPANAILVPCATGIYTVEPVSVTAAQ